MLVEEIGMKNIVIAKEILEGAQRIPQIQVVPTRQYIPPDMSATILSAHVIA